MARRFRQVDVFGDAPYSGNPLAVVLDAEGLDVEEMRRFSVWSNLSESTFVLPPTQPDADYRVRIFSLAAELPFAGHPTLGTARAWLDAGGEPATPGVVVQECGAGLVPVRIDGTRLAFAGPPSIRSGPVAAEELAPVLQILGIPAGDVVDAAWLDNGPGWVGVLLGSAEAVLALRPDSSRQPGRWDIGVIGPHADASEDRFELRAFFTDGDGPLREDPVTGSLNAAAAQWLLQTGRATAPYTARQGTALGRRGRLHISSDDDGRIWVGGDTHVGISGTIDLPGDHAERAPRISVLTGDEAAALAAEVWPCYDAVFGDFADYETWRSDLFERHAAREGYRLAIATDDPARGGSAGPVIGFAWGYIGERGQYWADLVWQALASDVASQWVGGHFELVELAVPPGHRGSGVGQALHDRLLDGITGRCLLSTSDDPDDPAVRLYTRSGWRRLGMLRPGVQVMGLDRAAQ